MVEVVVDQITGELLYPYSFLIIVWVVLCPLQQLRYTYVFTSPSLIIKLSTYRFHFRTCHFRDCTVGKINWQESVSSTKINAKLSPLAEGFWPKLCVRQ